MGSQAAGPGVVLGLIAGFWVILKGAEQVLKVGLAAGTQAAASLTCTALVRSGDSRLSARLRAPSGKLSKAQDFSLTL